MKKNIHIKIIEKLLKDLAGYYSSQKIKPSDFKLSKKKRSEKYNTKCRTRQDIEFIKNRLTKNEYIVATEGTANLRLPPDLIAKKEDDIIFHIERETRGWEWNHVFGALIKLLYINENGAPITVLILDNIYKKDAKLQLLNEISIKLFKNSQNAEVLYIALWYAENSEIYKFFKNNKFTSSRI